MFLFKNKCDIFIVFACKVWIPPVRDLENSLSGIMSLLGIEGNPTGLVGAKRGSLASLKGSTFVLVSFGVAFLCLVLCLFGSIASN